MNNQVIKGSEYTNIPKQRSDRIEWRCEQGVWILWYLGTDGKWKRSKNIFVSAAQLDLLRNNYGRIS